ncbi:MAG: ATP-binding cassette domain-containing protein, partial [Halocynthiibacter sp.]
MSPAVRLCGVSHHHAGSPAPVLASIELEVECGAVLALIGPSGAGKSTLLGLIGGQIRGWKGTAQVLGSPLSAQVAPTRDRRVDTGFIYQEFALIERATVRQNVLNGRLGRTGRYASLFGRFSIVDQAAADAALR